MLHLYPDSIKIRKAKKEFYSGMIDFVLRRIDNLYKIQDANTFLIKMFFTNIVNEYIDEILIGDPYTLTIINGRINPFIQVSPDLKKGIEYVFKYELFIKKASKRYDAYQLAESLDINTCPYCNRNYTNTVIRNKDKKKDNKTPVRSLF